jgi:hypothetical protein
MVQRQDLLAVVAEVLEFVDVPLTIIDGLTAELPLQVYHKLLQQVLVVPQAEDHEVLEVVLVLLIKVLVVAAQEVQIVVVLRFIMVAQVDQELL